MSTHDQQLRKAADYLAKTDPTLAPVIVASPLPDLYPHQKYYQELVDSIISQQLSVKAARTIERRFCELFGSTDFPTPQQILTKDIEDMRTAGLSRPKAAYIRDLAQHVVDGKVTFDHLDALSNDEVIAELTAVKGIGEWTAHMFLMFCMGRLDILPAGDLGIRNSIRALYNIDHCPQADEVKALAQQNKWHPYESVAAWYLWQSLDNAPKI